MDNLELKIRIIRDYLSDQFPGNKVEAFQDGDQAGPFVFRLDHGKSGMVLHRAVVPFEALRDLTSEQLLDNLSLWDLAARLRESGRQPVVVTREGLHVEGQPASR